MRTIVNAPFIQCQIFDIFAIFLLLFCALCYFIFSCVTFISTCGILIKKEVSQ